MKIRLYVEAASLEAGQEIECTRPQAHYLVHVMRLKVGDTLLVFNGQDGEWSTQVITVTKSTCTLKTLGHTRPQTLTPEVHLCFALLKQTPLHFLLEKATELGVTHFHPLITERTIVRHFNQDKQRLAVIEAAEQCGRLTVPTLMDTLSLDTFLSHHTESPLYLCDERREAPLLNAVFEATHAPYFLTGPEGGFSPPEFARLLKHPRVRPIRLAPTILRAETAALAALSQALLYIG
jgi:16S rRNA (uracil1498-N3)-methyltransferase